MTSGTGVRQCGTDPVAPADGGGSESGVSPLNFTWGRMDLDYGADAGLAAQRGGCRCPQCNHLGRSYHCSARMRIYSPFRILLTSGSSGASWAANLAKALPAAVFGLARD